MPKSNDELRLLLELRNRELIECRERFRTFMHRSMNGILIVDNSHVICYLNPAAESIFGCTGDQLLGKTFDFTPLSGMISETKIRTSTGRDAMTEIWAVETEWNRKPAWLVSLQDITDRKRNEQELRKMYRALLDSPAMVVITDAVGTIEYVNPKFTETTGYSFAEVIGSNLSDQKFSVASADLFLQMWETATSGGEWRGEVVSCRKNGELFTGAFSIAPIEDISGIITNFVAIIEDVTERKRYEEQLRSSEQQLAEAQKIAHLGSWKRYLDTGKSYWSDELYRIFGFEPGAVAPCHEQFLAMVHPDDREQVARMAGEALENRQGFSSYYCRIVRPDGSIRILLGQGEIIVDACGAPLMMIGAALDVTERKLLEEEIATLNSALAGRAAELEAANRELETFSYTVCHDLRSPLTNINGYCQVLTELCGNKLDEQCRGYLQEICRGTERMSELIETLLNFSLVTRGETQMEEVDLSGIALETVAELKFEHPERHAEFRIEEGITVTGDEGLLRVVMHNLLGNAWKYSVNRKKAIIEFGRAATDNGAAYFIRDNGIGFRSKDSKRLFAPFQRLSETDNIKGHGIGLATAHRIIERHGGRIWAKGEPGKGATFFFTL